MLTRLSASFLTAFFILVSRPSANGQNVIVILGSSSAAGHGANNYANSWAGKYGTYIRSRSSFDTVINLAVYGAETYSILPDGSHTWVNPAANITKALSHNPTHIIINLPTNDVAHGRPLSETMANYRAVISAAGNIPVWISTPQGRNFSDATKLNQLKVLRDSTVAAWPSRCIDFWNGTANPDGSLNTIYNSGDGVHLNNDGHELLFQRVKGRPILGFEVLPVIIRNLRANPVSSGLQLTWDLLSNEKISQEVQKSKNGISFISAGTLSSSTSQTYSFVDKEHFAGITYYRLKLSNAASVKYSNVLRVSDVDRKAGLAIFPNPISDRMIRFQYAQGHGQEALLIVSNSAGVEVFRSNLLLEKGISTHSVQLPKNLSAGVYYLKLSDSSGSKQLSFLIQ